MSLLSVTRSYSNSFFFFFRFNLIIPVKIVQFSEGVIRLNKKKKNFLNTKMSHNMSEEVICFCALLSPCLYVSVHLFCIYFGFFFFFHSFFFFHISFGVCTRCSSVSINFRPPILFGHEQWSCVRDPDLSLAVHGVQDLHCVSAAPPRGWNDVLRQVRQRIPHVLCWHELHTYRWVDGQTDSAWWMLRWIHALTHTEPHADWIPYGRTKKQTWWHTFFYT